MNQNLQQYALTEEFVQDLIDKGDVNHEFGGKTMARICVDNGQLHLLEMLIKAGSKPNFLIRSAVRAHQYEILQYLIDQKFDVNETTETTASALYAAVMENLQDYGKLLLDNGADPTITFKNQALLSYAAKKVSPPFFKMLISYGAPISALPPAIPPLITALKNKQMNNVATLLAQGADPNGYCLSHDRKSYPLDVAFNNVSSAAMTMLLNAGARKMNIPLESLNESMQKQLEIFSQPVVCKDLPLASDLKFLYGQFKPLESIIKTLSAEIMKIREPKNLKVGNESESIINESQSFYPPSISTSLTGSAYNEIPQIQLTAYISRIRDSFSKFCDLMPRVINFSKDLDSKRLEYLHKLFLIFENDDKKKLAPIIKEDDEKWNRKIATAIEILNKSKNKSTLQKDAFIDYCNTELRKVVERFSEQNSVSCFTNEVVIKDKKDIMENSEYLAFYADLLYNFKELLTLISNSLVMLEKASDKFFVLATLRVERESDRLEKLGASEQLLCRCGLPYTMITEIRDSIRPKQDIVMQTRRIVESNKTMCENCLKVLTKCVRQCVK